MYGPKVFSLSIIIMVISILVIAELANAQSIAQPSVPKFTVKIVDNGGVQITIENQAIISNGYSSANIFYNLRLKDHDSSNWASTTMPDPSQSIRGYIAENSETGFSILLKSINGIYNLLELSNGPHQIDFQVEAINGYLDASAKYILPTDPNSLPVIIVSTSGWSDTQTIVVTLNEPTATMQPLPSPTPTSSIQSNESALSSLTSNWLGGIIILLLSINVLLLVLILFLLRKRAT
jgi:hypothetical protein